ncbi:MAG: RIP metalloprotease RseP [Candidatus Pacebacteria bacterium]|nr:RIP metalloprotease RseP [Candidatus Paceibacterota bacterium]
MSVILFILVLGVLILVHEFGHFIVAKRLGIRVEEFGIGLPPRAWGIKKGETIYSINWLPFGGFVKIFGENPEEKTISEEDKKVSFAWKPKWTQAAVMVAGVVFNLIFAWLLISVTLISGTFASVELGGATVENPELMITHVAVNSPAEEAGVQAGDVILFLDDGKESLQDVDAETVSSFVASSQGEQITFLVKRGGEQVSMEVISREGIISGRRAVGVSMSMVGLVKLPFHRAFIEGFKATVSLTQSAAVTLWFFVAGFFTGASSLSAIAGPVGIVGMAGDVASLGFVHLLSFMAFLSIQLAILNIIPFPALDGGRLLFLFIEVVIRKPLKPAFVQAAHGFGFMLLILLMLVVTWNDIMRLF